MYTKCSNPKENRLQTAVILSPVLQNLNVWVMLLWVIQTFRDVLPVGRLSATLSLVHAEPDQLWLTKDIRNVTGLTEGLSVKPRHE